MKPIPSIMLVCGLALGAPLAMAGGAVQSPVGQSGRTLYFTGGGGTDDTTNVVIVDGARKFEVKLEKDKVVSATVDGKPVDTKNVQRTGDKLRIVDEKGNVLFESDAVFTTGGSDSKNRLTWSGQAGEIPKVYREVLGRYMDRSALHGSPFDQKGADPIEPPAAPPKTMLGVTLETPDEQLANHLGIESDECTIITGTYEGLAADKAGIKKYDVVVAIDGKGPADPAAIRAKLSTLNAGDKLNLTIVHQGQKKDVSVALDAYDSAKLNTLIGKLDPIEGGGEHAQILDELHNQAQRARTASAWLGTPGARGKVIIERENNGKKERIERELGDNGDLMFPIPPAPPAPPAPPVGTAGGRLGSRGVFMLPGDDRMERLEDRIKKLEELLERIEKKLR